MGAITCSVCSTMGWRQAWRRVGVNASTAASELTYIKTRAMRMGEDGVAMVVAACHMGAPPHPFDTRMLSEPAEVQWILRNAPDREGEEVRPDACSDASTAQLEARVDAGCVARKQARRARVRCAQAGLRVGWPAHAAASADEAGAERDPTQPTMHGGGDGDGSRGAGDPRREPAGAGVQ